MEYIQYFIFLTLFLVCAGCRVENTYNAYPVISHLKSPVAVAFSPKFGLNGFLVAEQIGKIWCIYCNGYYSKEIVLNLSNKIVTSSMPMDQRGLLGMTLDPNFSINGYIYLFYSGKSMNSKFDHDSIISRFESAVLLKPDSFYKVI